MKIKDMKNWSVFWYGTAPYCKIENGVVDIVYGHFIPLEDLVHEVKDLSFEVRDSMRINQTAK